MTAATSTSSTITWRLRGQQTSRQMVIPTGEFAPDVIAEMWGVDPSEVIIMATVANHEASRAGAGEQVSTLNPSLASDLVLAARRANHSMSTNSGEIAVMNAISMLQMAHAANSQPWGVTKNQVRGLTSLSESTVGKYFRSLLKGGRIIEGPNPTGHASSQTYLVNLDRPEGKR